MGGIILSQKQEQLLVDQYKCAAKRILIINCDDDANLLKLVRERIPNSVNHGVVKKTSVILT
jgi:hypothetical protein